MTGFLRRAQLAKAVLTLCGAAIFLSTTGCAAPPGLGTPPVFYPAVNTGGFWTSGDLEGDGDVDLVVTDRVAAITTVLLNDGSGTMSSTATSWPHSSDQPVLGDVTSDGNLDLILGNELAVGTGSGGFGAPAVIPGAEEVRAAALLDGDSHLDLLVTHGGIAKVGVQLGDGAGGFAAPTWTDLGPDNGVMIEFGTGDLNGDGHLDVTAHGIAFREVCDETGCWPEQYDWSVLALGNGAGGFDDFLSRPGWNFVVADFDEDGNVDIAAPYTGDQFRLSLGDGTGVFPRGEEMTGPGFMCGLAAGDVDQDGHADLVTTAGSDQGWILYGDGDGGFPRTQPVHTANAVPPPGGSGGCVPAIIAQLDGAGQLDLAFISDEPDRVAVLLNRL